MSRAVSPVLATVLMLALTVLAFSIVWGGVFGWISVQRAGLLHSIRERLLVEDVWFRIEDGSKSLVTLYVRNIGLVEIEVVKVSLNGTDMRMMVRGVEVDSIKIGVDEGLSIDLRAEGWSWRLGGIYEVIIVTTGGVWRFACKP